MIVRKLIVSDGSSERELLLVGTIVVGRDPTCQLNDLDPLLSRRHAEFVSTAKGVTIRDLRSRNGILVNGEKVPEHQLKPGDLVQLGHLHLTYVEEAVVTTLEDETRSYATTETDMEVPTMAPLDLFMREASAPPEANAPTASMPIEDDENATVAQVGRAVAAAPAASAVLSKEDPDATRAPGIKAPAAVQDWDATMAPVSEETRAVTAPPRAARMPAVKTAAPTEARLVATAGLVVTEASPSCQAIIGARPETLVGGQLSDALSRSLQFVASGDGPSSLSLSIARALSGKTITITFKAGLATESPS